MEKLMRAPLTGYSRRKTMVILSSRSLTSWLSNIALITLLATLILGSVTLFWGSNNEELSIVNRSVKVSFEYCWKREGGREIDTCSSMMEDFAALNSVIRMPTYMTIDKWEKKHHSLLSSWGERREAAPNHLPISFEVTENLTPSSSTTAARS